MIPERQVGWIEVAKSRQGLGLHGQQDSRGMGYQLSAVILSEAREQLVQLSLAQDDMLSSQSQLTHHITHGVE